MKFFHTADWHLGKLVQGIYMTEDQDYILQQLMQEIEKEKPDAIIIAGDLYDRAVPPIEAVHLLDSFLDKVVMQLGIPVLAIAGNHDSPSRLNFGSKIMKDRACHISGTLVQEMEPVVLHDEHGEVHFHLVPYCDPSMVRHALQDDEIRSHNDAMEKIVNHIREGMDPEARHVFVGHAFVTPYGEEKANTSESERPLSIGGSEYVDAHHFTPFHYTALGHLHQAHFVSEEKIRYAGSLLKYSVSEERHKKGFYIVEIDESGEAVIEKRLLEPSRDMRTVEGTLNELLTHPVNEDYVFVRLTDEKPVLSPMEKVRSVYPNTMHIEQVMNNMAFHATDSHTSPARTEISELERFQEFYKKVKGVEATEETEAIFKEVLDDLLKERNETSKIEEYTNV
ncbi:exonuclease SbcCD subunit D [Virgibacillus oceani]